MKVLAVIPARYESTRFPGKPLADIHGKPMIQVVYENVTCCNAIDQVLVATDDERIRSCVEGFGGQAIMTSSKHQSGTDRIAEAVSKVNEHYDVVVNVQGDEPGIDREGLQSMIALFKEDKVDIATLVTPFQKEEDLKNPNRVKAILAQSGQALYFTRAAAPFHRSEGEPLDLCNQHVGVYGYRRDVLLALSALPPSPLELKESLEQLRWLENGYRIYASQVADAPFGIDSPEDLQKFLG